MKVQYKPFRLITVKMQAINANTLLHIKIQLTKRDIVFKLEVGMKFFRLKDEKVLQKICSNGQQYNSADDIVDNCGQAEGLEQ
jgi:hypothetical protein